MNPARSPRNNYDTILWFCLFLIVINAVFMAFYRNGFKSIWLDEAYSVMVASQNFNAMLDSLKYDSSPPFHYILLGFWLKFFSISESSVRSLAGIFYLMSLPFVFLMGKRFGGLQAGVMCTALFACSRLAVRHSLNVRMYSFLGLLSIVSTYLLLKYFTGQPVRKKGILLYIIVNIMGTFTHLWFFFVIFAHGVLVLFMYRSSIKLFLPAALASVLPYVPLWAPVMLFQAASGATAWVPRPSIPFTIFNTVLDFYAVAWLVVLIGAAISIGVRLREERNSERTVTWASFKDFLKSKACLTFLLLFGASMMTPLLISQVKPLYHIGRYTIILLFPFIMVLGLCLVKFGHPRVNIIVVVILVLAVGTSSGLDKYKVENHTDRASAEFLIKNARQNDVVIFTGLSQTAIEYYFRLNGCSDRFNRFVFPAELGVHPGWEDTSAMLPKRAVYEEEADALVQNLLKLTAEGGKIWFICATNTPIPAILKEKLDKSFPLLPDDRDTRGTVHDKILIYSATPG